jgi:redox-sensitive bicupin YhaK (pirin superfamily)
LIPLGAFAKNAFGEKMIKSKTPIDFQWPVQEPFLFCVHHYDYYPEGLAHGAIDPKHFKGRHMGQDFQVKDGFRLYHGQDVPGFPVHPHRGFETITIVRKGYVDHADSLGAAGRYGEGDVQWMTAGAGVQHSEMFPLLHKDQKNTMELFQIWLNLPKKNKMVKPHFKMLWADTIPLIQSPDKLTTVSLICGDYGGKSFHQAPPDSWASDRSHQVNMMLIKIKPGGQFIYPGSSIPTNRTVYFFEGQEMNLNGEKIEKKMALMIESQKELKLQALSTEIECLLLEAKPIGEPIVQHGPFVMTSREEIAQTFRDYQLTEFGGWPWPKRDMVHGEKIEKFAKYPDGKIERR